MAEELSSKLTISFQLLLSSSFPVSNKSQSYNLCDLPVSYYFSYLLYLQDLFLIFSPNNFVIYPLSKYCVTHQLIFVKNYKNFIYQVYCRSMSILFIIIFKVREMKEKGVPMSSMQSLCLFSLERCFPALILIASIIIVLLTLENKNENKNKNYYSYMYSISNLENCLSCYNLFSYAWYQHRMQLSTLINDTQFNIPVLENYKKYVSSVNYILICLSLLLMCLISFLFQIIGQNPYSIFARLFSNHSMIIDKLMVSIIICVKTFITSIIAQIKSFILNCDRFERHIRKNNLIRFYITDLFMKLNIENYNLCICQSFFNKFNITQMLVQMKQHFKHLKITIQAFLIRSSNQKKLPISNYQISFILKNSS